jgi:hypothetical protein
MVVVLLALLAVLELVRPPAWEQELETYVEDTRRVSGDEITLLSLARARNPERFGPGVSRGTHSNEVYGHRDLPYPPKRLYCLYVEREFAGAPASRQVLFVALHHDLHYADWVLHEGAREPFDADTLQALEAVGCHLPTR